MKHFLIGFASALALVAIVWFVLPKEDTELPPPEIVTQIDTVYVDKAITITETETIAKVDTIFVDGQPPNIIATGKLEIKQDDISGNIGIKYSYLNKKFTLQESDLSYSGEIITSETVKTEYVKLPTPKINLLVSAGFWQNKQDYGVSLGAGVRILRKFDLILSANTNKDLGIMITWRF